MELSYLDPQHWAVISDLLTMKPGILSSKPVMSELELELTRSRYELVAATSELQKRAASKSYVVASYL
jgi:hypothetical protein